jgi:hypothetical protein
MVEIAIVWDVMLLDLKFTHVSNHIYGLIGMQDNSSYLLYNQAQVRMQLTNSDSPRARTSPI